MPSQGHNVVTRARPQSFKVPMKMASSTVAEAKSLRFFKYPNRAIIIILLDPQPTVTMPSVEQMVCKFKTGEDGTLDDAVRLLHCQEPFGA
jgi:hypothetical protein